MNTCQHTSYATRRTPNLAQGEELRACNNCPHTWAVHDGELRYGPSFTGLTAEALLTPRSERSPEQRRLLRLPT